MTDFVRVSETEFNGFSENGFSEDDIPVDWSDRLLPDNDVNLLERFRIGPM